MSLKNFLKNKDWCHVAFLPPNVIPCTYPYYTWHLFFHILWHLIFISVFHTLVGYITVNNIKAFMGERKFARVLVNDIFFRFNCRVSRWVEPKERVNDMFFTFKYRMSRRMELEPNKSSKVCHVLANAHRLWKLDQTTLARYRPRLWKFFIKG